MSPGTNRRTAIGLAVCAAIALAILALRALELQAELHNEMAHLAEQRLAAAASAVNRLSLPPARPLSVCNDTSTQLNVPVVTALYLGPGATFLSYNSASDDWRSWTIPPHSMKRFVDAGAVQRTGWDGSAVFYAIELASGGTPHMFSGTSNDLAKGCLHIAAEEIRN